MRQMAFNCCSKLLVLTMPKPIHWHIWRLMKVQYTGLTQKAGTMLDKVHEASLLNLGLCAHFEGAACGIPQGPASGGVAL